MALDPHGLLAGVHPDLVRVMETAAQEPQAFQVTYGLRTLAAEEEAVATGHSTTMRSRHLANGSGRGDYGGKALAVDITPIQDGQLTFEPKPSVAEVYGQMAQQVKAAAVACGVDITSGIDWTSFKDYGHHELGWAGGIHDARRC